MRVEFIDLNIIISNMHWRWSTIIRWIGIL